MLFARAERTLAAYVRGVAFVALHIRPALPRPATPRHDPPQSGKALTNGLPNCTAGCGVIMAAHALDCE